MARTSLYGSNPRKFSEKIALHNQKQAEETRAFEQLMTDLTVSRVQYQKVQQLRLSQSRAPYYGGSLPNVNQIGNTSNEFQGGFSSGLDSVRGTRHHGLVERVQRDRTRITSPHRRPVDKHGCSPYGAAYLSPPPDNNWRRFFLSPKSCCASHNFFFLLFLPLRTNSDSALHTSATNPNPQDPFGMNQQMGRGPPQRNDCLVPAVFSFPAMFPEDGLMGLSKPLPKQLWDAKKVWKCDHPFAPFLPGSIFPSPEQNPSLSHYQGSLGTGGSLPDLSNLQFQSPLSTPLDPEDTGGYPNLSGGSSTGNLPAAMMHLGIGSSQGGDSSLSTSLSNPSIQASLSHCQLQSSLSNPSISSSLRLSSSSPRRRPAPISPLTLSPGVEPRRGLTKQMSPTMSPTLSPITQGVALDTNTMPREPPPPYPLYQQSQHAVDAGHQCQQSHQQQPPPMHHPGSPSQNMQMDFTSGQVSALEVNNATGEGLDHISQLENSIGSTAGGSYFDPSSSSLYHSQAALFGLGGSLQDHMHMKHMLYSNCSGGLPNIILTGDSSLSKDVSGALSTVPEGFDVEGGYPLEDELHIEPLSLDGLSMLSDPDMVLPDPSVEDSFRSDRL
uniref:CREB regulated transcription coactivator 3 n=1 Tax=Oryzias latipes TaxID=8090 RepID=A0A3P9K3N7_ORYLA